MATFALSASRAGAGSVVTTAAVAGTFLFAGIGAVSEGTLVPPPTPISGPLAETAAATEAIAATVQASIFTSWNAFDKTATVTLSGGNLTATATGTAQAVRAIDRQITGKFYWEVTLNSASVNFGAGCANNGAALSTLYSAASGGVIIYSTGQYWLNGVNTGISLGSMSTGGVVLCLALDLAAGRFWARNGAAGNWNANANYNPATGIGGLDISSIGGFGVPLYPTAVFNAAANVTANFGATAFTGAVPSGFTSGFTSGATSPTNALATQVALEEWVAPLAVAQVTQVALEEWTTVANTVPLTGGTVGNTNNSRFLGNATANSIYLTQVTAQQNGVANAVLFDMPAAAAPANFRVLIYDSVHSALLATGPIISSLNAGYNRLLLSTPLTLSAGTNYWVGYACDTGMNVTIGSGSGTAWWVSGSQSVTNPANPLVGGSSSTNGLMLALELDGAGALPFGFGTDYSTSLALSNYQRTATFPASPAQGARSSVQHLPSNGGQWYAEIPVGSVNVSSGLAIGLAATAWGVIQGNITLAYVYLLDEDGFVGGTNLGLPYVSGDVVGVAYDATHALLWWNLNNGSWFGSGITAGNPVTGTNGMAVQAAWPVSLAVGNDATTVSVGAAVTLRDTADTFQYAPPSGYAPWSSYINPAYIPPPPPPKTPPGQDKGKGQQGKGKVKGPPALRNALDSDRLLVRPYRERVYSPWAAPAAVGPVGLLESAATVSALGASVRYAAALTASGSTTDAVSSGRLLAALLAEGSTSSAVIAALLTARGVLTESGHGADAMSATAKMPAVLAASSVTSDIPYHGVAAPGILSESAATSSAITAVLAAKAALTEGSATSAAVAGFRTLVAALSESGVGSDALAGILVHHGFLAEGSTSHDALALLGRFTSDLFEGSLSRDSLAATAILRAALAEGAGQIDLDTFIATTHPLRHSAKLIGEHATPDLEGEWFEPRGNL